MIWGKMLKAYEFGNRQSNKKGFNSLQDSSLTFPNVFGAKKSWWYILTNLRVTAWIFKKFWLPHGKLKTSGLPHGISQLYLLMICKPAEKLLVNKNQITTHGSFFISFCLFDILELY